VNDQAQADAALLARARRATVRRSGSSPSRSGASCTCTATGCWLRPRRGGHAAETLPRRLSARWPSSRTVLAARLAVPDRHQPVPQRAARRQGPCARRAAGGGGRAGGRHAGGGLPGQAMALPEPAASDEPVWLEPYPTRCSPSCPTPRPARGAVRGARVDLAGLHRGLQRLPRGSGRPGAAGRARLPGRRGRPDPGVQPGHGQRLA